MFLWRYDEDVFSWTRLLADIAVVEIETGDITGNRINEIVLNIPGLGIYYYNQVSRTWHRIISQSADCIALAKPSAKSPKEIIASFYPLGTFKYNLDLDAWTKIIQATAETIRSGNTDKDQNGIDELAVSFKEIEGLYIYRFKNSSLVKILNQTPSQFYCMDIQKSGNDSIISVLDGLGVFLSAYCPIFETFQFSCIINSTPLVHHKLGFGDIADGDDLEMIMTFQNTARYFSFSFDTWYNLINAPFSEIISGKFSNQAKDDLLLSAGFNNSLYLRKASDQQFITVLSNAYAQKLTALK